MLIRKLLIKILGFNNYLAFISRIFIQTFVNKWYLGEHKQVRFVKNLVQPGDICIDIGANLGYFSVPLSKYIGTKGKLYSVEPVASFRKHLIKNLNNFGLNNTEVLPYALGEEDHKKIQMITPEVEGVIRHGRTEVKEISEHSNVAFEHETELMRPQTLFGDLPKIDFIKCDVEGYELHIIPLFTEIIKQKKPILEIEIDPIENKKDIIALLTALDYKVFFLGKEKLQVFDVKNESHLSEIELYFIPDEKIDNYKHLISKD
jgi:FkbM family methyltransferase